MRQRLLIPGVGALFAMAVACAFGLDAFTSHRERLNAVERETQTLAALLADQARQLVAGTDQTLRVAALAYDDWLNDPRRSSDTGFRMLKSIKGGTDAVESLHWFDARGDHVATSASPKLPAVNIRDREHFHVHAESGSVGMFMGAPVQARNTDRLIAVVSRRIDAPNAQFAGVAAAILNMSYLMQVLQRYRALAGVHATLYLRDGTYIAHYPNPEARMGRVNGHTRLFREELPKADRGTFHATTEVTREERIFSYQSVAGYPIVAVVSMTRSTALAPWHGRTRQTGGLALLAVVAAGVATAMIYRQARRLETERLRALEARFAAEEANRSKSEFLAHMSHELRTPMNAVIGFTEMMTKEVFGPIGSPKYREYLGDIALSGQHLLHVVNNVLDLAKVEAGKWEMEETECGLRALCESSLQMVRERARSAEVSLSLAPGSTAVSIRADRRLMYQILINLLTNGIKFTERGGRVTLRWSIGEDASVALAVADTGVGMSDDDLRRVLEPYGRGSAELARTRHDTGLGLSLCKRFAEMHGGRMEIESALGKGTTVRVILPRERVLLPRNETVAAA